MSKRRRLAVVCASCAAIIPGCTLLLERHGSNPNIVSSGLGFVIGLAFAVSVGLLVKSRMQS